MRFFIGIALSLALIVIVAQGDVLELEKGLQRDPLTFAEASESCRKNNEKLLEIKDIEKSKEVYEFMQEMSLVRLWLGMERRGSFSADTPTSNWWYLTGGPVNDEFWGPGEPNNFRGHNESCGEIRVLAKNSVYGNFNDRPCDTKNPFICVAA